MEASNSTESSTTISTQYTRSVKVGDMIYVYPCDDYTGGLTSVLDLKLSLSAGVLCVFVCVHHEGKWINWEHHLQYQQDMLKERYGDTLSLHKSKEQQQPLLVHPDRVSDYMKLKEYQALGSVEQIELLFKKVDEAILLLSQYQALGTVEELRLLLGKIPETYGGPTWESTESNISENINMCFNTENSGPKILRSSEQFVQGKYEDLVRKNYALRDLCHTLLDKVMDL